MIARWMAFASSDQENSPRLRSEAVSAPVARESSLASGFLADYLKDTARGRAIHRQAKWGRGVRA